MKTITLYAVLFLTVNFAVAQTPPPPVFYNFENPSLNQLTFNNAEISTSTPVFRVGTPAGATNPNLIYIEINTASDFTGVSSTQSFPGAYVNGTATDLTFNTVFTPVNNEIYYVRAKASGDGGSTYSSYSAGTYTFMYVTSGSPEWHQTYQVEFKTDSLSGDTALALNVQLTTTAAGANPFANPSFESTTAGPPGCSCMVPTSWNYAGLSQWDTANYAHNTHGWIGISANEVTNGFNSLRFWDDGAAYECTTGAFFTGDYLMVYQQVNLKNVSAITFTADFNGACQDLPCGDALQGSKLEVIIDSTNSALPLTGTVYNVMNNSCSCTNNGESGLATHYIEGLNYSGTCTVKLVEYMTSENMTANTAPTYFIDNVKGVSFPSGTITSSAINLGSLKGGGQWSTLQWNQTLHNSPPIILKIQKAVSGGWTDVSGLTSISAFTDGNNSHDISSIPVTTLYDSIRIVATLTDTAGTTSPSLNSWVVTSTSTCTTPVTPVVTVTNNCGSAVLRTTATGALVWSTGASTSSITVTNVASYSVTTTVSGCTSVAGSNTSAPKSTPSAPLVTIANNCGSAVLSTTTTGALLWNTGVTTSSITVTNAATYSVTTTVSGCTSAVGTNTSAPKPIPSAPLIDVANNCGNAVLSTTATGALFWNTGASTSSITVTNAATYSVTTTVNGCTSSVGTGISSPISPATPQVNVINNCGNSVLSTTATGALTWSTGAITSSITVTNAATYSVTTTVSSCTSAAGSNTSAPKSIPSAPLINVTNNCGSAVLSTTATGALLWNTGVTTSSITVTNAATYSVTTTVSACTSAAGSNTSAPKPIPSAPIVNVANDCDSAVISTGAVGALLWNTGVTTSSITVTNAASYSVTTTVNGCTSSAGTGISSPVSPATPQVNVTNNCGNSVLAATGYTGTLAWSTGATTSTITVTTAGTYSVTANNSCGAGPTQTKDVTINQAPAQPGSISGNTNVCQNSSQTYFINSDSGATSYIWSLPSGWSGASSSTSITYATGSASGTVSVAAHNSCGNSIQQTFSVTVIQNVIPGVSISANPSGPVNDGDTVTFTAIPANGGTDPKYEWSNSGRNIPDSSPVYVCDTLKNGDQITCMMTSNASCILSGNPATSNTITIPVITGINETRHNYLIIYPNPNSGIFNIENNIANNSKLLIKVSDDIGKVIYQREEEIQGQFQIDLGSIAKGIYFIQANDGDRVYRQKLIIE